MPESSQANNEIPKPPRLDHAGLDPAVLSMHAHVVVAANLNDGRFSLFELAAVFRMAASICEEANKAADALHISTVLRRWRGPGS